VCASPSLRHDYWNNISISIIIIDIAAVNRDNQIEIEIKKQSVLYFTDKTSRKYLYLKGLMESNLKVWIFKGDGKTAGKLLKGG